MPFKVIINIDPEIGEVDKFLWTEKEEPSPLVRPKTKPKNDDLNDKPSKEENKS